MADIVLLQVDAHPVDLPRELVVLTLRVIVSHRQGQVATTPLLEFRHLAEGGLLQRGLGGD